VYYTGNLMNRTILLLAVVCLFLMSCAGVPPNASTAPTDTRHASTPTMTEIPPATMTQTTTPTETPEYPLKMLALGDSYTIGESVFPQERWSVQLAAGLRENGIGIRDPKIIARTGWTTSDLADAIIETPLTPPYDLVTLLIGVNNQYRGGDVNAFREEFSQLLEQAVAFAGGDPRKVVVLSIPDWGATPFGARRNPQLIAMEIDSFNQAVQEETQKTGCWFFDITPISRQAVNDPDLVARDDLHPSGKMYAAWVELILPALIENWLDS
jgi:lysophospholipase L1-like esterase